MYCTLTINSKLLGKKLTFTVPDASYIYVDLNGQIGCLGNQICEYGELIGSTLYAENESDFIKKCKSWYRMYLRKELDMRE